MDNVAENEYLKMCKNKRGHYKKFLNQVVEDLKKCSSRNKSKTPSLNRKVEDKKSSSPKTTVRKPGKKIKSKKDIVRKTDNKKCTHNLYILYKQETDRRYCKKGMELEGFSCSK